ncbi:MAG: hypothetical protein HC921_22205 [Synechococcaceae cyanobacterium SM2_3_1]|nr:hypothetical protein [Synechococcaceae cyanobacterium SM2_3_1]
MKLFTTGFETEFIDADDLFECLRIIRQQLEIERGYKILCKGAKQNVHPSSLSRQMNGGVSAYELTMGSPARMECIINIFDEANPEEVDTVDHQMEFYRRWVESL